MSKKTDWLALDDFLLEQALACQTRNVYERTLAQFAETFLVGEPRHQGKRRDGDPCRRRLWGLTVRAVEYERKFPRADRTGLPWTWAELKILQWAFVEPKPKEAHGRPDPDNEYVANLLQRTVAEVKEKRGLTRSGTAGFGLFDDGIES